MKPKSRGNGQGTAYFRKGSWTACVIVGWRLPADPSKPKIPVKRTKAGFKRKRDALAYCAQLLASESVRVRLTLQQIYDLWKEFYASRVGESTMEGYRYAYMHFKSLHDTYIDLITVDDLQKCMDECPSGHRTHQNMKTVAGLLWAYAVDKNLIDRDITDNLFIGRGTSVQREPLTDSEVEAIRKSIGKERYAEYIYCLCYLGFRPGEFLSLRKDQIFCEEVETDRGKVPVWFFVNGSKTDAGKDRMVLVPVQILDLVLERLMIPGTDLMFPMYRFTRGKHPKLIEFKQMTDSYFRVEVFKPMMRRLGIAEGKVPYSARHTYADKLKEAAGSDRAKAASIGHSNYLFTQMKYQSTDLAELKTVVDSFE